MTCVYFHSELDDPVAWERALQPLVPGLEFKVGPACVNPERVDVALIWTLPAGGLEPFTQLKAVLSLGAGVNQIGLHNLPDHVPIARLVDPHLTRTMVEYAKAAVFRHHRKFHLFEARSRQRVWEFVAPHTSASTSVAVLGLGELGSQIAQALAGEGFAVGGWRRSGAQVGTIATFQGDAGMTELLRTADIIVNVLPLTDATDGLLNADFFARCKPGVCLVNMGRGRQLVEDDFLSALEQGLVEAATLDVFEEEPLDPQHPYWNHPRILPTPHVAGIGSPETSAPQIAQNIARALQGLPLINALDRSKGY